MRPIGHPQSASTESAPKTTKTEPRPPRPSPPPMQVISKGFLGVWVVKPPKDADPTD